MGGAYDSAIIVAVSADTIVSLIASFILYGLYEEVSQVRCFTQLCRYENSIWGIRLDARGTNLKTVKFELGSNRGFYCDRGFAQISIVP
eukprot:IDg10290t1